MTDLLERDAERLADLMWIATKNPTTPIKPIDIPVATLRRAARLMRLVGEIRPFVDQFLSRRPPYIPEDYEREAVESEARSISDALLATYGSEEGEE